MLFLAMSFLLFSCEREVINNGQLKTTPITETQQIKNEFSLKDFKDVYIKENLVVNWGDYNTRENIKEDKVIYEFNTLLKAKSKIENAKQQLSFKYKVLAFKENSGNWSFEILKQ